MNSLFRFGLPVFMLLLITAHGIRAQQMTGGQVHGNFQVDVQTYDPNPDIGITEEEIGGNKMGSNGFGNFIYTNGDFTAGARFEYYLKPLVGFDPAYEGGGIPYRFASYRKDMFEITVGNFYEQFGNGLIFRSYEEWSLGYDNSVDGIRVRINPIPGISIKGIYGTQRYFWERYEDGNRAIIKGGDAEFFLNEMVGRWKEKETRIILGGSVISKYEKDDPFSLYKYPENVTAFAGRFNLNRGRIHMLGEYAYKINDPSAINHNIYKEGQSIYLSGSYSCKGLGITLSTKWIDNMSFKSRRYETGNALEINFLPPLTKQHSYGLEAMYPYATQPNGEFASQGKVIYTIPKKTKLGGRYGTTIELSYSRVTAIDKRPLNDTTPVGTQGTLGYKAPFFGIGDEMFFDDFNVELTRKLNPSWKIILAYTYLLYNIDVIEEGIESGHGHKIKAHVGVADITYKMTKKNALRLELQYLQSRQDSGNWVSGMLEYTIAPKWFFSVRDEYNYNNPSGSNTYHYYSGAVGYTNKTNRISLAYGLQREGILCVGGVCRQVPASSGLTLTITSSF